MPWDKKFIELSENDDYLEDFFVNKNVTKTDENTIKDDTKDKDKGVFVIPTNPILIDTKIAEEEEEIYEVEVAGIQIDFGQDILDILGYTGPDLGFPASNNDV